MAGRPPAPHRDPLPPAPPRPHRRPTDERHPRHGRTLSRRTLLGRGSACLGGAAVLGRRVRDDGRAARLPTVVTPRAARGHPRKDGAPGRHRRLGLDAAGRPADPPFFPDSLAPSPFDTYVFGFRDVTGMTAPQVAAQRGQAQISAPMLSFDEEDDITITLTNLGLLQRPDLFDGHTLHWHGFVNAIPLFDGVPELSLAVPVGRDFTYFYRPHDAGTYMYHCHFEDVEHVQMGMTGMVFVRPKQNRHARRRASRRARSTPTTTATGRTRYDREFAFMITELWSAAHYRDAHIQVSDWTDYDPSFWLLNGRGYPDTSRPTATRRRPAAGRLQYQPISLAGHLQRRRTGAAAAVEPRLPEPRDDGRQHRHARSSPRTPACSRAATAPRTT